MTSRIAFRRNFAAALTAAFWLLLSHSAAALSAAELKQLREEIAARSAENHKLRTRYVMESARFAKAHHPDPCVYDVGIAEDTYESALGAQSAFIDGLAVVAESPSGVDQLGSQLEFLPRQLETARAFEATVTANTLRSGMRSSRSPSARVTSGASKRLGSLGKSTRRRFWSPRTTSCCSAAAPRKSMRRGGAVSKKPSAPTLRSSRAPADHGGERRPVARVPDGRGTRSGDSGATVIAGLEPTAVSESHVRR